MREVQTDRDRTLPPPRPLRPGERWVDGEVCYSAAWLTNREEPTVVTSEVFDLETRRMEQKMAALDDETLLFVMLGLLAEPSEGMRFTPQARMSARVGFGEVCRRWVPLETFGAAFNDFMDEDDDDKARES